LGRVSKFYEHHEEQRDASERDDKPGTVCASSKGDMTKSTTWFVSGLRATVFFDPTTGSTPVSPQIYKEITGHEPEEILSRREISRSSGAFPRKWKTLVGVSGGRIDLTREPILSGETDFGAFIKLKDFREVLRDLALSPSLMARGLQVTRIAMACALKQRTTSAEASTQCMYRLIPYLPQDPNAVDLMVRVNRPVNLPDGTRINRFASWASTIEQNMLVNINGEIHQGEARFQVQFDADVNTVPCGIIEQGSIPSIVVGLIDQLICLAENGDRP